LSDAQQNFSVGMAVRVHPGTEREKLGHVVEDFGEIARHSVDIGDTHFADPARRWAVIIDDGGLVFVDSDQLGAGSIE
jgi:hypothetical protein